MNVQNLVTSKAQMEYIKKHYPKAIWDEKQVEYFCTSCGAKLKGYYSKIDLDSIGLVCPACGLVHHF